MPANLPPAYHKAEEAFRQARSVEEKIACLEDMLRIMPKHKGTDKLQAGLRARIAKLRRQPQKKGATRTSHMIRAEGAGQVALVGEPNSGKSTLVGALTRARPEVAPYPFTTREPVPGMMEYQDISFQLIDLPPLSADHSEPWVFDLIRRADLLWIVVPASNSIDELNRIEDLLAARHIGAVPCGAAGSDPEPPAAGWSIRPALLVVTRLDEPGGVEDIEILKEFLDRPWPVAGVSGTAGIGLDALRRRTFEALEIIRVYTKQPGKPPDRRQPYTFRCGATVGDLARTIHKEVDAGLRFARIWGTGVFDGQTVTRDHVLADGDVVEIHT